MTNRHIFRWKLQLAALAGVIVACCAPASAAVFTSSELSYDKALLSQFNLISLGQYSVDVAGGSQVLVNGRVVAGSVVTGSNGLANCISGCNGNTTIGASSSTTAGVVAPSASNGAFGALTVFGNVVGNVAAAGGAGTVMSVGGNLLGNSAAAGGSLGQLGGISGANQNTINLVGTSSSTSSPRDAPVFNTTQSKAGAGGGPLPSQYNKPNTSNYSQTLATVFPFASEAAAFTTPLKALYSGIANLPGSPNVKEQALQANQSGFLSATTAYTANGLSYGVITTSLDNLLAASAAGFTGVANGTTNAATFVIVTGDGAGKALPALTYSDAQSGQVIYDFVGASTLSTSGAFNASILAPFATLTNTTGNINGTVVVASMIESQSLSNTNAFTGDLSGLTNFSYNSRVPEPASFGIVGIGIAAAAWARRRHT